MVPNVEILNLADRADEKDKFRETSKLMSGVGTVINGILLREIINRITTINIITIMVNITTTKTMANINILIRSKFKTLIQIRIGIHHSMDHPM